MSIIKSIKQVLGLGPAAENHFWDGSVPNQLSLKRGTPEAPGVELIKALNGVLGICAPVFSGINAAFAPITSNTAAKLSVDTVQVDSAGWWDAGTKRYIPQIAGWYRVSGMASGNSTTAALQLAEVAVQKNGVGVETGSFMYGAALANVADSRSCVSCMVYCNGTTDYIELWGRCVGAGTLTIGKFRLDIELAKIGA